MFRRLPNWLFVRIDLTGFFSSASMPFGFVNRDSGCVHRLTAFHHMNVDACVSWLVDRSSKVGEPRR